MLRFIFVSRTNIMTNFVKWATNILFTLQIGNTDQKHSLFNKILGTNAKIAENVLKSSTSTIPCVYFFTLGYVKDLREKMKIDNKYKDDQIVSKFGRTISIVRRIPEHETTFGKMADLKLKYYSFIDLYDFGREAH